MTKYTVYEICRITYSYEVKAESKEEAKEKVENGSDDVEYLGEYDTTVIEYEVEEQEEKQ